MTDMRLDHTSVHKLLRHIIDQASTILLGKQEQIQMALACILSGGHLLIEDLPGVGKTTLSHVMTQLLGLECKRIQFTSDLLPADILGTAIYNRESGQFQFQQGPIFTHVLLADEINRATPKAQSALLEAMEEGQITVDGESKTLPNPFFVIGTQNPGHHIGTFPLPESQLDRFMMCITLGYPNPAAEREILKGKNRKQSEIKLNAVLSKDQILSIRRTILALHASDAILDYVQALIEYTRDHAQFGHGLSPRGSIALLHGAKAWAYLNGRLHVLPEDVQTIITPVLKHRFGKDRNTNHEKIDIFDTLIKSVPIP